MSNKILVLGGTGKTGSRVVKLLQALNLPVQVGSRNANPPFDWEQPHLWNDALVNIEKLYITFQPDLALPRAAALIHQFVEAAKKANIKKLVLLSGRGEKEAEKCESHIIQSGIDHTIIRASWFMQNFSEGFLLDAIINRELIVPKVEASEPFVDADDIAEVAVEALIDPSHNGKVYELTGPELLSFENVVAKISAAINENINYNEISLEEYIGYLKQMDLPEEYTGLIHYLFSEVLDGRNESVRDDIEKILKKPARTITDYIQNTLTTNVWNNKN